MTLQPFDLGASAQNELLRPPRPCEESILAENTCTSFRLFSLVQSEKRDEEGKVLYFLINFRGAPVEREWAVQPVPAVLRLERERSSGR